MAQIIPLVSQERDGNFGAVTAKLNREPIMEPSFRLPTGNVSRFGSSNTMEMLIFHLYIYIYNWRSYGYLISSNQKDIGFPFHRRAEIAEMNFRARYCTMRNPIFTWQTDTRKGNGPSTRCSSSNLTDIKLFISKFCHVLYFLF